MSGPVALRSANPVLVEAVRSTLALAGIPLVVHPPGAEPPESSLALDSAAETSASDPPWRGCGRRFAWVGIDRERTASGDRCLLLPDDAETVLAAARAATTARRARVLGVVGSRGGAGASVLAAVLARSCAEVGLSTGLVDIELGWRGLDMLLGIEHVAGLRWADLLGSGGYEPAELAAQLPPWHGVRVLAADARSLTAVSASNEVIAALADAHDVLVLDLPRSALSDGTCARWCDHVLVASTCDVAGSAGVHAVAGMLAGQDAQLVVRGPSPGGIHARDIAEACGLPLALSMPVERSLPAALERGIAPGDYRRGPLVRGARSLVRSLALVS